MATSTHRVFLVGALSVLFLVGAFMAVDRSALHLYSEEPPSRENIEAEINTLRSDVDSLTSRADANAKIRSDVDSLTARFDATTEEISRVTSSIAKFLAYRLVQEYLFIPDLTIGHPQVVKCAVYLLTALADAENREGSSADCGLFAIDSQ